jgi:ArsR family transcriptional regulator, arsenate/arsenite/antimonite-responsive transcriptional repressor
MSKYKNSDAQQYADMFKALSNPYRVKIFMRLASCCGNDNSCTADDRICECVGVLGQDLGIAASTVSHHIKELHRAGLINLKRNGQRTECTIDPEVIDSMVAFFKVTVTS